VATLRWRWPRVLSREANLTTARTRLRVGREARKSMSTETQRVNGIEFAVADLSLAEFAGTRSACRT